MNRPERVFRTAYLRGRPGAPAAGVVGLVAVLLAACAQQPATRAQGLAPAGAEAAEHGSSEGAAGPLYGLFHRALQKPAGSSEFLRLQGEGVQIFRCETQGGSQRWVYRLPEAQLRDAEGRVLVRHGAGLSFEHVDSSRLVGEVQDHVPAPREDALPWVLLRVHSYGKGALAGAGYVLRTNTVGGMPPPACEAAQLNQVLRVPFSAEFSFLR